MSSKKQKWTSLFALLVVGSLILSACAQPTPEVIKEQVIVEKEVPVTVEVVKEVVVEKEVIKTVEVEKEVVVEVVVTAAPTPTKSPKHGGVLTYGLSGDLQHLDPHDAYGAVSKAIKGLIYGHLVTWDRDFNLIPDLAESWDVVDPTTIVFTLRKGVTFHNGEDFTSEDVKYSMDRIQSEERGRLPGVIVETPDEYTVRFILPQPDAIFFNELAEMDNAIVSKEWMESGVDPKLEANGTGPFKYVSREPSVEVIVERFDDYYDKPLPYLDGIKWIPYSDDTARVIALRTGELDLTDYIPWRHMNAIEKEAEEGTLKFYSGSKALMMVMFMNRSEPPFDDKRVRHALQYGFDRQSYGASTFFNRGEAMSGSLISPAFQCYDPTLEGTFYYDPEKAKALLEEVGWRDEDGDGIREAHGVAGVEDGTPFKVNFFATSDYLMHYRLAELAQANYSEIGIGGELELVDWPERKDRRKVFAPFEIQADGRGAAYTDPAYLGSWFHSTSTTANAGGFADPEIDELLDLGRATYGEERCEYYNEVDRRMLDESHIIFAWRREQGEASQPYVMGFTHTYKVESFLTLREVWLDK